MLQLAALPSAQPMLPVTRVRSWISTLCIMLLLATAVVQASHVCGFGDGSVRVEVGQQGSHAAPSGTCEICATAHQTPVPAIALVAPTVEARPNVPLVAVQPHSFVQPFIIYVRPPPAVV
jgi:hypothetical protein